MAIAFDIDEAITLLRRTPAVLKELLGNLPEKWTHNNEGGDSWSPHQVLGHLVYGEDADWLGRTKIILDKGTDQVFEPFDRLAQERLYSKTSIEELLTLFEEKRIQNLKELESFGLTESDLEKKGVHPEFWEIELKQMLSAWVVHDMGHIVQINRTMAKNYVDEVGPWKKYLTVVRSTPAPEE